MSNCPSTVTIYQSEPQDKALVQKPKATVTQRKQPHQFVEVGEQREVDSGESDVSQSRGTAPLVQSQDSSLSDQLQRDLGGGELGGGLAVLGSTGGRVQVQSTCKQSAGRSSSGEASDPKARYDTDAGLIPQKGMERQADCQTEKRGGKRVGVGWKGRMKGGGREGKRKTQRERGKRERDAGVGGWGCWGQRKSHREKRGGGGGETGREEGREKGRQTDRQRERERERGETT